MGLTYNPANSDFYDVSTEKTDHKTDHKTEYKNDNVNHPSERVCSGPWWDRR